MTKTEIIESANYNSLKQIVDSFTEEDFDIVCDLMIDRNPSKVAMMIALKLERFIHIENNLAEFISKAHN